MAEMKEETDKPYDPFAPLREMRDAYLDSMSKTMAQTVNSEAYAKASGTMLDYYLTASSQFREEMEKMTAQALQQLSLPTRQDVASLAERFTNIELRVDDLDAKLDRVLNLLAHMQGAHEQKEGRERAAGNKPS